MVRLHALVEGQTEESFINGVLAPELWTSSVFIDARCVTTGRKHGRTHKGGGANYQRVRRELIRWMKEDGKPDSWFTSMFDVYQLDAGFPGFADCLKLAGAFQRVQCLERKFVQDISQE